MVFDLDYAIHSLKQDIADGWIFNCATRLSVFLEAERENIIDSTWRQEIDVELVESLITDNIEDVVNGWVRDFKKLEQIKAHRRHLIYEEVIHVLSLRSTLESGLRYLTKEHSEMLIQLDIQFNHLLEENSEEVIYCQTKPKTTITQNLSSHWWWQSA